jgi:multimeric flavodoxin WrbA
MHIVAINTDPEKEWGVINVLLAPLLEGMEESGASVELYYSRDLLIFPCCGNLNCTVKTPGKCMAYDDMRWLRGKIGQADVLVLASPLYFNGFTGRAGATPSLKLLLDRLVPGLQVPDDMPYEHALHTTREQTNLNKVVLVSGCGFLEIDGFDPVLTHLKAFCCNTFPELGGCITGPRGAHVKGELPEGASESEIIAAARAAGRELVRDHPSQAVPPRAHVACDGRAGVSWSRREWSGEILYKY